MPTKAHTNTGRCGANTRTMGSAAAFSGCIGLPDNDGRLTLGDGGLRTFGRLFNRRFDELAATTRPEWRSLARESREMRGSA